MTENDIVRFNLISTRNLLLSNSDWIVIKYTELGLDIPQEWKVYRQALRDITLHPKFNEGIFSWPEEPTQL